MDKSVLVFSLLTWENKLLHRGHMLAKYFAQKDYTVYYVQKENISSVKQLSFSPGYYEDNNIKIISLPAFPYMKGKVKSIYGLNDFIMTKQLKDLFSKLENPLILLESPYWIKAVNRSRDRKGILCYDISDDFLQFTTNEKWKNILSLYEKETIDEADYIFITAEELREKVQHKAQNVFLIENGIDLNQFENAKDVLGGTIKRPICGFIGGLFQWIDFELLGKLADKYREYSFVLIGPTDQSAQIDRLREKPNVHYLGEQDKSVIGDYFASLDMGLIPFVSEDKYPRLKTVNSNKIFQYCYFGYPVISTAFQQVNELKQIISVNENQEDYIQTLGEILERDSISNREKRKSYAYDNSWAKRVEDILHIVNNS